MKKLLELISKCKGAVEVKVNSHKTMYDEIKDHISEQEIYECVDNDVLDKMVELDTIVEVTFYPHTPVGHCVVYHYDVDKALDEALQMRKELEG